MHPPPPEVLTDHGQRLFRYACHKRRTHQLLHWLTAQGLLTSRLARLGACHAWMVFRYLPESQRFRLAQTRSCDLALLCPLCAIRRAARAGAAHQRRAAALLSAGPGALLSYAVLTIRNGADLAERFEHLQRHARLLLARLRAADCARRGHRRIAYATRSCLAQVAAGAYSFEVKRGANSGLWHPHLNLLLLSPEPINEARLSAEWRGLTRDSHNVYCQERPNDPGTFVEIFKYALKFSDLSPADTYHVYQTLTGRRLLGSFGAFRRVALAAEDSAAEEPYRLLLYHYWQGAYHLREETCDLLAPSYVTGRSTGDSGGSAGAAACEDRR